LFVGRIRDGIAQLLRIDALHHFSADITILRVVSPSASTIGHVASGVDQAESLEDR
jgi:hypothetical protein